MTISFRPAKREQVSLLIGLAGGTGSGKTFSALRLAKGLADGKQFAFIDTEARRGLHYADAFDFDYAELRPPFRPAAYAEAIEAADKAGYPVIVVDSASHEHAGEGGLLEWHDEEYQRLGGTDKVKMTAWIKPKTAHKAMVNRLLQVHAHVILCFRAEEKVEIVKDAQGKTVVQPKRSLTGLDGWMPVSEKNLPYELTLSFLLTAGAPGLPKPIKLQEQHRAFVPLDQPISEETGRLLGEWAKGASEPAPKKEAKPKPDPAADLADQLLAVADKLEMRDVVAASIAKAAHEKSESEYAAWLGRQLKTAEKNLAAKKEAEDSPFKAPDSAGVA